MKISIHNKNLEIHSEVLPIGVSDFSTNIINVLVATSIQQTPDCFALMDMIRVHLQKDIITNCDPVEVVLLEFSQEDLDLYSGDAGKDHIDVHELVALVRRCTPYTDSSLQIRKIDFKDRSEEAAASDISYFFRWEFTGVPVVEDILKPDEVKCMLVGVRCREESLFIPLKYFDEHMQVVEAVVMLWNQRRDYNNDYEVYFDLSDCEHSHDRVSLDFYYIPKD